MDRERRTVGLMVALYCRNRHKQDRPPGAELCRPCRELLDYAMLRLDRCRYQEAKTTCARCPNRCYKPEMREKIREVMRYAGPRMLLRHPVAVDGRPSPQSPVNNGEGTKKRRGGKPGSCRRTSPRKMSE